MHSPFLLYLRKKREGFVFGLGGNMIEVSNLSMSYGRKEVLKDISFQIEDGEVIGLLGANGAGKSTTMNLLTGYRKPDSGEIIINGNNLTQDVIAAKKEIGYLPEVPPLYKDMKVIEYLEFYGELKKVKKKSEEAKRVMELFDLYEKRFEYIKHLSKGWQQRVGFAGCLLGNPSFLILDEPLVGLDPAESKKVKELIRSLSKEHTILISSHILKEIEELCTGIIMLKDGTIAFMDSMKKVQTGREVTYRLTVKGDKDLILQWLNQSALLEKAEYITEQEENVYVIFVQGKNNGDIRDNILGLLNGKGFLVYGMERQEKSLEDIFMTINKEEK